MKKVLVLLLLFTGLYNIASATGGDNISREAKETFNNRFPNARYAEWHQLDKGDAYQVTFIYNNQRLISFINLEGRLLGFARSVMNESLPYLVNEAITTNYKDYVLDSVDELVMDDQVSYLFTLENEKTKIDGQISSGGHVSVIRKINKTK